jgi:DNA mismatch repair protein MutS2
VTLREGRYVLAVRGEDRSRLRGIVHGRSKTGHTVFLEPLQAVDRNNAIASLEADEHEERVAILGALSLSVVEREAEIVESYEVSGELDLLRAMARLSLDLECVVPSFNDAGQLRLVGARHPLLAEASRLTGAAVVPLDLDLVGKERTLVLSGPNMGGKTVALKGAGLLCAMAQSGLHVPAREGTDLPFVDSIFADLGDEQSIESETSTFAGHLQNIAQAWSGATSRSLVLLDELGGGTDPEEGTALGRSVVELLSERGCLLLATTHLVGLKIVAHEDERMRNGAMEFDAETRKPTYRLKLGAPGRSRAFELARQILPPGELTERAEKYRTRLSAKLDELLGDLEEKRAEADREIEELEAKHLELAEAIERKDRQAAKLRERLQAIRESRAESRGRSLAEAERLLSRARGLHNELQSTPPASGARGATEQIHELEEQVRAAQGRSRRSSRRGRRPLSAGDAKPGRSAWSHDLKSLVKIDSEPDASKRVWILHGTIRFHVPVDSLGQPPPELQDGPQRRRRELVRGPETEEVLAREIDIRGRTAREGLEEIERYVDRAAIAGVPEIRIIHGKGKGILKREIEAFLRDCPLVESFRTGEPREGGWGATIVRVRSAQVGA